MAVAVQRYIPGNPADKGQQLLSVAWGRLGVPQSLQQPDDPDLPVWAEHIAVFLRRQTETTAQVCLRRRGLLEKLRGNV